MKWSATTSLILITLIFMPYSGISQVTDTEIICGSDEPVLYLTMLIPNSGGGGNSVPQGVINELAKACIGIDELYSADWNEIASRTWEYNVNDSLNGKLPPFEDGGFDILLVGFLNVDAPAVRVDHLYHSDKIPELGGFNIYRYKNSAFDDLYELYDSTRDVTTKNNYAKEIQKLLYEDQPSITLYYPEDIWVYNTGWNIDKSFLNGLNLGIITYQWADFSKSEADEITIGTLYEFDENIPHFSSGYSSHQISQAIWEGLYTRDLTTLEWVPLLASDLPQISDNQLEITINIETNILFANGIEMDIFDVHESFRQVMDSNFAHRFKDSMTPYFGVSSLAGGEINFDDMIEIIDNDTLKFNLLQPHPDVEQLFTFPILPEGVWNNNSYPVMTLGDLNQDILNNNTLITDFGFGTGPYVYHSYNADLKKLQLKSNANYSRGTVVTDYLTFMHVEPWIGALDQLSNGELDLLSKDIIYSLDDLSTYPDLNSTTLPAHTWQEVAINNDHPILGTGIGTPLGQSDPSRAKEAALYVRKAISHSIPRQEIVNNWIRGIGIPGVTAGWVPGSIGWDESLEPYEYSVETALNYLELAGYDIADPLPLRSSSTITNKSSGTSSNEEASSSGALITLKYQSNLMMSVMFILFSYHYRIRKNRV